jgi:serine/threonine protein kinase
VWSFGITCLELLSNGDVGAAYPGLQNFQVAAKVVDGHQPVLPDGLPAELMALLEDCFNFDPEDRPTFSTLMDRLDEMSFPDDFDLANGDDYQYRDMSFMNEEKKE